MQGCNQTLPLRSAKAFTFQSSITAALLALAAAGALGAADIGPGYDIELSRMIPMRDGVGLEAWITKPSRLTQRAPAILTLTQYDIDGSRQR